MTEKQFNVFDVDGTIFLEDHKKGSYHIGEIGNVNVNCLSDIADRLNELNDENKRLTDKLNQTALELVDGVISQGKAVEISEMSYNEFLDYRAKNGKSMELQL